MTDKDMKTMEDIFLSVFDTNDGRTMLYWIANECGVFQEDPTKISPERMAFWHKMLRIGGVTDPRRAGALMQNLMITATRPVPEERRRDEYDAMAFLDD